MGHLFGDLSPVHSVTSREEGAPFKKSFQGSQRLPGLQPSISMASRPNPGCRPWAGGPESASPIWCGCPSWETRSDLLTGVLLFAVHSLRPSDIRFVAAIGHMETVSISRRWTWEVGFGTRDPLNELLVSRQNVSSCFICRENIREVR